MKKSFKMEYSNKTKDQLIDELENKLQRISELEELYSKSVLNEDELKASEERMKILFEYAPDAYYLSNIKGELVDGNKAAEKMVGYKKEELIGKNFSDLKILPKNQLPLALKNLALNALGFPTGPDEFTLTRKDGKQLTTEIRTYPVKIKGQNLVLGIARDITDRKKSEIALKKSEEKYRWRENRLKIGMDMAKLVYWEYDGASDMFTFDDQFYALYGTTVDDEGSNQMSSEEYATRFVPPEEQAKVRVEVAKAVESTDPNYESSMQHWIIRGDGERRYLIVRIRLRFDENGQKIGHRGVNQDITEQKMAEDALKESDQRLAEIIEFLPDATFAIDVNGKVISWNRAIKEITQVNPEEILGRDNYEYALPVYGKRRPMLIDMVNLSEDEIQKKYGNYEKSGNVLTAETEVSLRGDVRTFWVKAVPFHNINGDYVGAIEVLRDISDLRNAEKEIKKSLEEKEMLLKEIHHRVKNNLMIISSLLNLQSGYIKDKASKDIFKESQNRARSMALIHERLYQSTDLKRIDFGEYITSLANELFHTYVADPSLIELKINVEDIFLDINTAVPLGLIVNELITNSLKHAFPEGNTGEINVDFHLIDDHYKFTVKDNGIGFPEDLDYQNTDSLGLQMVNSLTDQIDGEIILDRISGTEFNITFIDPVI